MLSCLYFAIWHFLLPIIGHFSIIFMEILFPLNIFFTLFRRFFMVNCYSLKRNPVTRKIRKLKLKTILIIEDEIEIRNFIARVLELEGYKVLAASDGISGMNIIRDNPVSLVMLDLRLPGLDGWSILREIKRNQESSRIPVVVLTAIAETTQRKRTLRMGAASYLIKPLSAHSLSRAVASVLHEKSNRLQATQENEYCGCNAGSKGLLRPGIPPATAK
jgi:CheY-like chemotaxis protein